MWLAWKHLEKKSVKEKKNTQVMHKSILVPGQVLALSFRLG